MDCITCGAQVDPADAFCKACGAPVAPPQTPSASQPSANTSDAEPPKKRTGLIIAVVVLAVLFLCACVVALGFGGLFAFMRSDAQSESPSITTSATPDPSAKPAGQTTPTEAVDAFYTAVGSGDIDQVRGTLADGFDSSVDESTFEGWQNPGFEVVSVNVDDAQTTALVEVQEYEGGLANGPVTFNLVDVGDGWRVSGWTIGSADAGADAGENASPQEPVFDEAAAIDVVGRMLNALKEDDVDTVRALATTNFKKTDPTFFRATNGVFMQFEVTGAERDGGTWLVSVDEVWNSGPETLRYVVVIEDGKVRVDGQL